MIKKKCRMLKSTKWLKKGNILGHCSTLPLPENLFREKLLAQTNIFEKVLSRLKWNDFVFKDYAMENWVIFKNNLSKGSSLKRPLNGDFWETVNILNGKKTSFQMFLYKWMDYYRYVCDKSRKIKP